ncbi:AraC family transcriptional regulator [Halopseudomonas sabulinigri]|uniref:AraC family transcriptional regulator n=1 Tax=Halopseudomonas sabulinigri TaxID=472181 RepID=A0ABP9ZNK7_9GAMM
MSDDLLQAVEHHTRSQAHADGLTHTALPGLTLVRSSAPTELEHALARPLLCLVLQGCKQVSIGAAQHRFGAGDSMLVSSNLPTLSRIVSASTATPYLAVALDLDVPLMSELTLLNQATSSTLAERSQAEQELKDAVRRLVQALHRPQTFAALKGALLREIHHWLLMGPHGDSVRQLGLPDSHVRRIARAVTLIRSDYTQTLSVTRLAAAAGMSRSAFHQHFRTATTLSPLQFQKQLRLIEARRLLHAGGLTASRAAFEVGYESISQFSREYARLFGLPPGKDRRSAAQRLS